MRKLIITAGAAVALAFAVTGTASASVNVDASGGAVGKGDVQSRLGFNNEAMQTAWSKGEVKFTADKVNTIDYSWKCSDGSTQHSLVKRVTDQSVNVTALTTDKGKLSGWTLAVSSGSGNTTIDNSQFGPLFVCPTDSTMEAGSFAITGNDSIDLKVNNIALPNTPVEVAPVA